MPLIPYRHEKSKGIYDLYYDSQKGGNLLPAVSFKGVRMQKGYGLGSVLTSLLKTAIPTLKQGAKALAKTALKTGLQVAQDGLAGQNIKRSINKRFSQAGVELLNQASTAMNRNQSNGKPNIEKRGKKRKQMQPGITRASARKKRARHPTSKQESDIFN